MLNTAEGNFMRRRHRFGPRRGLRRITALMGPEFQRTVSNNPDRLMNVKCSVDLAKAFQIERDLRLAGAAFDPSTKEFSLSYFGREL
jgi:hypothetical protein